MDVAFEAPLAQTRSDGIDTNDREGLMNYSPLSSRRKSMDRPGQDMFVKTLPSAKGI